ncbi:hypothetical protein SAMN04487848_1169 [Microbacterium sp. ru370.1]|uniref:hypothetical protein n=1 Tax=unclassified Microbacterium TaxID=2609290 RepID=UPI0008846E2C|nr:MULTISPECIES: hypothetical protein [unclassified Microbacterium]SDO49628.1 hypothetical protein SAMN04487848_1169 [Microbacterium sp. ru370.1]SIT82801.1 hypothetical protein SAMN05880579_1165 [Microbacterium sp. RU1D]
MNTRRIIAAMSALTLATGLAVVTTAASAAPSAEPTLPAMDAPLLSQSAGPYTGKWKVAGGSLEESFELDGATIANGTTALRGDLAADQVVSFGYVAGFGDPATGAEYAQLSGQAGSDITGVSVVSASGVRTAASLVDGVWGAVWPAGDSTDEFGAARIEVSTPAGTTTVSTDDVDVIAADQRAADQG